MTLGEMKKKVLSLIEELNPLSEYLTDDPDIQAKINEVINSVMFELSRFKKMPKYVEIDVNEGDILEFADIEKESGYEVYQIDIICGVRYVPKASGTIFKFLETGTAEISFFAYPERITEKTKDKAYEFELSNENELSLVYGMCIVGEVPSFSILQYYGAGVATRSVAEEEETFNWAGTYTVTVGEIEVDNEDYNYPKTFEMEITYDDFYGEYVITKFFGQDVTFGYNPDKVILKNITLRREKCASGKGKSQRFCHNLH